MYAIAIFGLMAVLPLASIVIEYFFVHPGAALLPLVGRWFVFWAVGARLFVAGLRQTIQPRFTAETVFGIRDPGARKVVVELGFANLCTGVIGLASLAAPGWVAPAALAGGLFYLLAGIQHLRNQHRNQTENLAMLSDLGMGALLAVWLVVSWSMWGSLA
jgi:hypothetical protein